MVKPVSLWIRLAVGVVRRGLCSSCLLSLFLPILALTPVSLAQAHTSAVRAARVQSRVDNKQRTVLRGHTVPALAGASDMGRIAGSTPMNHMVMVLQASPEQEHALRSLIDQQLDKNHANFHRWMKPEDFGSHFGVADSDIAQVT